MVLSLARKKKGENTLGKLSKWIGEEREKRERKKRINKEQKKLERILVVKQRNGWWGGSPPQQIVIEFDSSVLSIIVHAINQVSHTL